MNALNESPKQWFSEISEMWPGQALSLEVTEVLVDDQSKYQHVQVLKTPAFGTVLVLDGAIQCTTKDEYAYHEALVHIPMYCCENPQHVLIVGGGDGGCVREVLKHKSVTKVVLCEIDQMVIDVSKKFLPEISCCLENPRVTIEIADGAQYAKLHSSYFDVIIVDASDPIGPASTLYSENFYANLAVGIREGGVLAAQAESIWLHLPLVQSMVANARRVFRNVDYANISIPSYPGGCIGALVMANHAIHNPQRRADIGPLRYYSPHLHRAAFVLPQFARDAIGNSEFPDSCSEIST